MKQLWDEILAAGRDSSACLATVVATEGTAPRKDGSKMLVIGGRSLKGAVTIGGCVDAQVIEASGEVARSGRSQLLRIQLGEEDAFEIGLTCAGTLRVLVEPARMGPEIATRIQSFLEKGAPFALLTVTHSSVDSVKPSAKAIVSATAEMHGSLGDNRLDEVAVSTGIESLSRGIPRTLDLDSAFKPADGFKHAAVELFIDIIGYNHDLFIFGAVQVAMPVARLASETGFRVHVVDTRPMFASRERFPTASEILVGFPGEIAQDRKFDQFSFALLLAHAAKHDLPVLEALLRSDVKYIGVLGGYRRAAALSKRLKEMGFSDKEIARIHMPVGLDIGAETAEQIAVAVVAELLMVRSARTGKSSKLAQDILSPS